MSQILPIIRTKNFDIAIKSIPNKEQKQILYNLTHMNRQDALRMGYLKGDLNCFQKLRNGDYRILLAYCANCYSNSHHSRLQCAICDEKKLERIIVFHVFYRKKGYRSYKMGLKEIQF